MLLLGFFHLAPLLISIIMHNYIAICHPNKYTNHDQGVQPIAICQPFSTSNCPSNIYLNYTQLNGDQSAHDRIGRANEKIHMK
jgi:hypothetical protein